MMKGLGRFACACAIAAILPLGAVASGQEGKAATCPVAVDGSVSSLALAARKLACAVADRRLLIVGEIHGSNETPDLVAATATDVASRRPLRVGFEMPAEEQPSLQAYLRSGGTPGDREHLLETPFWSSRDGRSSAAMLRLIDRLRRLRAAGADVDVFAMEPAYPAEAIVERQGGFLPVKEAGMAKAVTSALGRARRDALVMALMGNFHARYGQASGATPAGSVTERLAPVAPYVVLPFARRIEAWNCTSSGCGVSTFTSHDAPSGPLPRFVTEIQAPSGPLVIRLWLATMSASPPAQSQAADEPVRH